MIRTTHCDDNYSSFLTDSGVPGDFFEFGAGVPCSVSTDTFPRAKEAGDLDI